MARFTYLLGGNPTVSQIILDIVLWAHEYQQASY